jgi:murein L,D-transpeptidase YafK
LRLLGVRQQVRVLRAAEDRGLTERVQMKSDAKTQARSGSIRAFAFIAAAMSVSLAGCGDDLSGVSTRAYQPLSSQMLALMQEKGTAQNAPILIRTYKKEAEFEIWKMASDGRYVLLKTYPMCRWSGQLGPKKHEGDRQVPEGFYSIAPGQMNPHSAYYLSFNVGYPNAYDRAHGYAGGNIMVHGACSSAGCFSMTDQQIAEIYSVARDAFLGGQHAIQMQSLPFHMTPENFAKYRLDPSIDFWKELKVGTDNFEMTRQDVAVGVCNGHYVFNARPVDGGQLDPSGPCPALKQDEHLKEVVAAKQRLDESKVAELAAQGVKPVRTIYADGGQNPSFSSRYLPNVSRPDALAQGPVDVAVDDPRAKSDPKAKKTSPVIQTAATSNRLTGKDAPQQPVVAAAAPPPEQPQNAVSMITNFWNGQNGGAQPTPTAQPADAQPANVPLPPRRLQAAAVTSTTSGPQQQ